MALKNKPLWKKGRGKLGVMAPLLGTWSTKANSPIGPMHCTRRFELILGGHYMQLTAEWKWTNGTYKELAVYGVHEGKIAFWSFTSDGKRSEGVIASGKDVHPESVAFEAHMPAGLARMIYWPGERGGLHWAVEAKTKKGWKRFTEHHYTPA